MTHPLLRKTEDSALFWNDECEPNFGRFDLVETAAKPRFGKNGKQKPAHKIERELPRFAEKSREKYGEGKKPALVIEFAKIADDKLATYVNGVFIIVQKAESSKKWEAQASFRAWKTPIFDADDPASALKRLVHFERWFCHRASMEWWSLGKLYRLVHFVFPFGKRKRMPKAGTFDRDFSSCKHVAGRFAWNPAQASTTRTDIVKPVSSKMPPPAKTKPAPMKTSAWSVSLDEKYMLVNGVLTLKDHWQDPEEYIGRI